MFPKYLAEIALVFIAAGTGNIQDLQVGAFQKVLGMPHSFFRNIVKKILAGFLLEDVADVGGIAVDLFCQII